MMTMMTSYPIAAHPGAVLAEVFREHGLRPKDWATKHGLDWGRLSEVLERRGPLKPEMVQALERDGLDTIAVWQKRQADYVADCERLGLWDAFIYEVETRRIHTVAGVALPTNGGFHTVAKRLETVSGRLNASYDAVAVPGGLYGVGDTLPENVRSYDEG